MVLADVRTTVATYRYDPFSLWVMKSAGDGFTLLGRVVGRQVALRFLNRPRCFQAPLVEDASLAAEPGPTVSALKVWLELAVGLARASRAWLHRVRTQSLRKCGPT